MAKKGLELSQKERSMPLNLYTVIYYVEELYTYVLLSNSDTFIETNGLKHLKHDGNLLIA